MPNITERWRQRIKCRESLPRGKADFDTFRIPLFFIMAHILFQFFGLFLVTLGVQAASLLGAWNVPESASTSAILRIEESRDFWENPYIQSLCAGVIYSLLQISFYRFYLRQVEEVRPGFVGRQKLGALEWLSVLPIALGCLGFAVLWFEWLYRASETMPWIEQMLMDYDELSEAFSQKDSFFLSIVGGSILIPVAEELLFRGIIYPELDRSFKPGMAIFLNGLLFAVFHMNLTQGVYVFVAGCAFAAVYAWSGSIYLPILLHMTYNFWGSDLQVILEELELSGTSLECIELVALPLMILFLYLLYRKAKRRRAEEANLNDARAPKIAS